MSRKPPDLLEISFDSHVLKSQENLEKYLKAGNLLDLETVTRIVTI